MLLLGPQIALQNYAVIDHIGNGVMSSTTESHLVMTDLIGLRFTRVMKESKTKISPGARRKARHYGMQALYQWHMTGANPTNIETEFAADNDMAHVDREYFRELIHNIPLQTELLDQSYTPYLQTKTLTELDPITLALIRIAAYELKERIDVPYRVIITEAVSLAKKFGATDSYKFINGVLDQLATELRRPEMQAHLSKKTS